MVDVDPPPMDEAEDERSIGKAREFANVSKRTGTPLTLAQLTSIVGVGSDESIPDGSASPNSSHSDGPSTGVGRDSVTAYDHNFPPFEDDGEDSETVDGVGNIGTTSALTQGMTRGPSRIPIDRDA